MNIGDTVFEYKINLKINGEVKKTKVENKVIAMNEEYLCINTYHFNTLQFKNERYNIFTPIEVVKVHEYKWKSKYSEDEINGYIYTTEINEKKMYKKLKKKLRSI